MRQRNPGELLDSPFAVPLRRLLAANLGRLALIIIIEKRPSGVNTTKPLGLGPNTSVFLPSCSLIFDTRAQLPWICFANSCSQCLRRWRRWTEQRTTTMPLPLSSDTFSFYPSSSSNVLLVIPKSAVPPIFMKGFASSGSSYFNCLAEENLHSTHEL